MNFFITNNDSALLLDNSAADEIYESVMKRKTSH